MDDLVQLVRERLTVEKVPRGVRPVIETHLAPHQRIVHVEHVMEHDYRGRKTVDWTMVVWVETRIEPVAEQNGGNA